MYLGTWIRLLDDSATRCSMCGPRSGFTRQQNYAAGQELFRGIAVRRFKIARPLPQVLHPARVTCPDFDFGGFKYPPSDERSGSENGMVRCHASDAHTGLSRSQGQALSHSFGKQEQNGPLSLTGFVTAWAVHRSREKLVGTGANLTGY
jgi:hypothetical protein